MNTLARFLAVYLALVFIDAAAGFGLYRSMVHSATGAYCALTNKSAFERFDCTSRVFYSRPLWMVISLAMGLAGGYVTMQAMKTAKW